MQLFFNCLKYYDFIQWKNVLMYIFWGHLIIQCSLFDAYK